MLSRLGEQDVPVVRHEDMADLPRKAPQQFPAHRCEHRCDAGTRNHLDESDEPCPAPCPPCANASNARPVVGAADFGVDGDGEANGKQPAQSQQAALSSNPSTVQLGKFQSKDSESLCDDHHPLHVCGTDDDVPVPAPTATASACSDASCFAGDESEHNHWHPATDHIVSSTLTTRTSTACRPTRTKATVVSCTVTNDAGSSVVKLLRKAGSSECESESGISSVASATPTFSGRAHSAEPLLRPLALEAENGGSGTALSFPHATDPTPGSNHASSVQTRPSTIICCSSSGEGPCCTSQPWCCGAGSDVPDSFTSSTISSTAAVGADGGATAAQTDGIMGRDGGAAGRASANVKRRRCGECGPCKVTVDCGECRQCIHKAKLKQVCVHRKCEALKHRLLPGHDSFASALDEKPQGVVDSSKSSPVPSPAPVSMHPVPKKKPGSAPKPSPGVVAAAKSVSSAPSADALKAKPAPKGSRSPARKPSPAAKPGAVLTKPSLATKPGTAAATAAA
eukprot:scpid32118/ scgid19732/ 